MDKRQEFSELLKSVLEQAVINDCMISAAEIDEAFEDMELDKDKLKMVYDYLELNQVTITGYTDAKNAAGNKSENSKKSGNTKKSQSTKKGEDLNKMRQEEAETEEAGTEEAGEISKNGRANKTVKADKLAEEADGAANEKEEKIPDTAFFKMYLKDLRSYEKLNKKEESALLKELVAAVKEKSADAEKLRDKYIGHKLHYVVSKARRLTLGGELLDELVQEGNIGLLMALSELEQLDYDEALTHIENQIEASMRAYIDEIYSADSKNNAMIAKVTFVSEAAKALKEENGADPSVAELARYTNMTEDELMDIINLSGDNLKSDDK